MHVYVYNRVYYFAMILLLVFMYSYEIHLCTEVRRKGLGKFLMQILELIGHKYVPTYTSTLNILHNCYFTIVTRRTCTFWSINIIFYLLFPLCTEKHVCIGRAGISLGRLLTAFIKINAEKARMLLVT